ncbi:hypothetical protein DUI87_07181 [Hirundo rustica rustica]|uniref:Reverse transcriptase/retrotransposon-derived protein RNase H-like domain-containing protein n=1 Tax=Hirundo rustica rustica TaxID=333673 RepID=A0A3M0KP45_HIRRU|nr:hypothetical protein DUI87_07181 [Hirundo rustica rustica]
MHITEYSQIVSPFYLVTRKKNIFRWDSKRQHAFAQIKQEITHEVALGPVRMGPDVKNVQPGAIVCPGTFGRKGLVRLEANHQDSGVKATKGLKPTTLQQKKKS